LSNRCTSGSCGGGGYYGASGGGLTVSNSTFDGNYSEDTGGGIWVSIANATLTNLEFTANVGNGLGNGGLDRGGALRFASTGVSVISCDFIGNQSGVEAAGTGSISSSLFEDNFGGRALHVSAGTTTVSNTVFQDNSAGAIYQAGGVVNVSSSQFLGNGAANGGAVILNTVAAFEDVLFEANTASSYGGAVYWSNPSAAVDFEDVRFEGNSATNPGTSRGGAIYGSQGDIDAWNVEFIDNTSSGQGGATWFGGILSLNLNNVVYSGNSCVGDGGAVYTAGGSLSGTMRHLSVGGNTATGNVDGFYISNDTGASLVNSVVWGNGDDDFYTNNIDYVTMTYTCSTEFLGAGAGNEIQVTSPWDIGPNGELFLVQNPQNLCVDGALDATANTSYSSWGQMWGNMTTAKDSSLDVPAADMGFHYFP
jgi:predicted outer membrane repeat protein